MNLADGGLVGGPVQMTMRRAGQCPRGHCLYVIDGGPVEHILTPEELAAGDHAKVDCQRELEALDPPA